MAILRDRPYVQFNFLVDLGTGTTEGPEAGFQECSGIGMEVTVAEYRNGNEKENSVRKITGLNKSTDVTLKRGVIGSLNLYQWLNQIRNGDQAAFVGFAAAGPLHVPVPVEDPAAFADLFGADAPLAWDAGRGEVQAAHLAPAVRAFFRQGGRRCWVVRTSGPAAGNVLPIPRL